MIVFVYQQRQRVFLWNSFFLEQSMQIRARVRGKVQGVYFRASTRTEALALGLIGYAVNNDDGSVTVVAEGSDAAIQQLLTWLASGPEQAEVVELNHSMSNENLTDCFFIG